MLIGKGVIMGLNNGNRGKGKTYKLGKRQNPFAKSVYSDPLWRTRVVTNKKLYNRKKGNQNG